MIREKFGAENEAGWVDNVSPAASSKLNKKILVGPKKLLILDPFPAKLNTADTRSF